MGWRGKGKKKKRRREREGAFAPPYRHPRGCKDFPHSERSRDRIGAEGWGGGRGKRKKYDKEAAVPARINLFPLLLVPTCPLCTGRKGRRKKRKKKGGRKERGEEVLMAVAKPSDPLHPNPIQRLHPTGAKRPKRERKEKKRGRRRRSVRATISSGFYQLLATVPGTPSLA